MGLDYLYRDTTLWKRFSKKKTSYSVSGDRASACSVNFPPCFIFPCDNCDFLSPVSISDDWNEYSVNQHTLLLRSHCKKGFADVCTATDIISHDDQDTTLVGCGLGQ